MNQVYDNLQTVEGLCRRLDTALVDYWVYEKNKLRKPDEEVSLKDFTEWICGVYKRKQNKDHILNPENKEGPSSNYNTSNRRPNDLPPRNLQTPPASNFRSNENRVRW